ncbi:MAG: glycosyltransferase [Peptococcaceae bacterium]|jgi:processive 1,2-diacylglycerol beta-glucosyltransferase|nr:glycosyltransferase [Peptococcaceae bacterium]
MRVMILSSSFGDGHMQVALSIREAIGELHPGARVETIDYYQYVSPLLNRVVRTAYIGSCNRLPFLYGLSYRFVDEPSLEPTLPKTVLNNVGRERLWALLVERKPAVIVNTFPSTGGVVSILKEKRGLDVPCVTIITDYDFHSQWLHRNMDLYCVATPDIKRNMQRLGIDGSRIVSTGIPIRRRFFAPFSPQQVREAYDLDPGSPVVLLMAGAYGVLPDVRAICGILASFQPRLQVVVVCGRNVRLYRQLQEAFGRHARFRIFSYLENIQELMGIADLVITKAGCLTITEALHMRLPILVYRPVPGQEAKNTEFLLNKRMAILATTLGELQSALERSFTSGGLLAIRNEMTAWPGADASRLIAQQVLALAGKTLEPASNRPANG